jgi:hypothetical protein
MAQFLSAASLMISSEKLKTEKKEALRPVATAPPAVLQIISELSYHLQNIGIDLTPGGLYMDKDLFVWEVSFYLKGEFDGTYYLFITAEGKLVDQVQLKDSD